jgi:hypothetical protein
MINRKELRIGNIIYHIGSDTICKVKSVDHQIGVEHMRGVAAHLFEEQDLAPILLTADVLKKCGFTTDPQFSTHHLSPIHLQEEEEGWYMKWNTGYVNRKPLTQLHHLQNLYFALTGEELPVSVSKFIEAMQYNYK